MTKEQLIKEFREKFPHKIAEVIDDFGSTTKTDFEAFLLSTFDAGRASGIEEVREKLDGLHRLAEDSCKCYWRGECNGLCNRSYNNALSDVLSALTPSSSKDN